MQTPMPMKRNKRKNHCFHALEEFPNLVAKAQGKGMPRKAKTSHEQKENPSDTMEHRVWDGKRKGQRTDLYVQEPIVKEKAPETERIAPESFASAKSKRRRREED